MTALEDFENTLKEVVNAKRLSASKMNKLTEIAMKSLQDDTKLVATLYRTHKSLPSSAKVSSLYAFDALARAARSSVTKRGITGDMNSAKGNAATFLLKIEGVLEGLFQDMVSLNNSDAKEKANKVLDIWVKSNTFPSSVLAQLRDILSDIRKAIFVGILASNEMRLSTEALFRLLFPSETTINPTPSVTMTIQPAPTTQITSAPDVQATLLALLGQAAQVQNQPQSQAPPNTDPQQLQQALLKQLALTAKLATPPPGQTPPPTDKSTPPAVTPAPEPLHPPSRVENPGPGDTQYGRNGHPDRGRDRHSFRDDRQVRGGFRGGFRGRGRWDDGHSHDRFRHRDRDFDPHSRPRRSRSRSPRRHKERRDVRPHSPPRRPLNDRHGHHQAELPTLNSAHSTDEFGRDIRTSSASPSRSMSVDDKKAIAPMDPSVDPIPGAPPDYHTLVSDQLPLVAESTSAQSTETHTPSSASQQQPGLDQFDIATFDATTPSSWEALGNMWQTTYGYPPSQEELMHFVMAGSMAAAGMPNGGSDGAHGGEWQQGHWEDQAQDPRRNGALRGRGGGHHAGAGGHRDGNGYANMGEPSEPSCAVVINGGADVIDGNVDEMTEDSAGQSGGGGGRMQRVGDKWMFVRDG